MNRNTSNSNVLNDIKTNSNLTRLVFSGKSSIIPVMCDGSINHILLLLLHLSHRTDGGQFTPEKTVKYSHGPARYVNLKLEVKFTKIQH